MPWQHPHWKWHHWLLPVTFILTISDSARKWTWCKKCWTILIGGKRPSCAQYGKRTINDDADDDHCCRVTWLFCGWLAINRNHSATYFDLGSVNSTIYSTRRQKMLFFTDWGNVYIFRWNVGRIGGHNLALKLSPSGDSKAVVCIERYWEVQDVLLMLTLLAALFYYNWPQYAAENFAFQIMVKRWLIQQIFVLTGIAKP